MTTAVTETTFHHFFDDAAIFPPGLAPLPEAVSQHLRYARDAVTRDFLGPLVLPLDKIGEAIELADGAPLDVSVVVTVDRLPELATLIDGSTGEAAESGHLRIDAAEVKVGDDPTEGIAQAVAFRAAHPGTDVFVELTAGQVTDESAAELRHGGLALKFRTGGIRQDLFPSADQLITVLDTAVRAGLPFKLTAGLHRAMRYTDTDTGFDHFGFLNIAAATAALRNGRGPEAALELLNSDDTDVVATQAARHPRWRDSFRSFGTCSLVEPAETLGNTGLLRAESVNAF